jgi:hypothetical protein
MLALPLVRRIADRYNQNSMKKSMRQYYGHENHLKIPLKILCKSKKKRTAQQQQQYSKSFKP